MASGPRGRWFITVDDLDACLTGAHDSRDAAFDRLGKAFQSARLLADAGLRFVVAPVRVADGEVLHRLDARYSVVLHHFLDGTTPADSDGGYPTVGDPTAMVALAAELHAATTAAGDVAIRDDLSIPLRNELLAAIASLGEPWDSGPYGERARALLEGNARDVERLLVSFDALADHVTGEPDRYVITHGELGVHNLLVANGEYYLVDWESARLAAPERDLRALDPGDGSAIAYYEERTGTRLRKHALDAYQLWYDLYEIGGYIELFRNPHGESADSTESWKNLQQFLRPRDRWPDFV